MSSGIETGADIFGGILAGKGSGGGVVALFVVRAGDGLSKMEKFGIETCRLLLAGLLLAIVSAFLTPIVALSLFISTESKKLSSTANTSGSKISSKSYDPT